MERHGSDVKACTHRGGSEFASTPDLSNDLRIHTVIGALRRCCVTHGMGWQDGERVLPWLSFEEKKELHRQGQGS